MWDICDFCDYEGPGVVLDIDPYASELYGDETDYFICEECARNRADDI